MNSKELVKVSVALWVPLTWYALASSRSLYRWLYPEGNSLVNSGYIEGNPLDRAVYSALIAAGLLILFKRKIDWSNLIRADAWILLLFIYMGLSIFWSEFRDVSFKRLIKAAGDLIMVLVVLTEINARHSVSTLLKRCFYVYLPLSIIMIKYFRTIGVAWRSEEHTSEPRHSQISYAVFCLKKNLRMVSRLIESHSLKIRDYDLYTLCSC